MAIKESTATALVRFTGLGFVVFNKEKQRGEIGIIRDEKHKLSIRIQAPKFKDGIDKDIIVYEDIANYADLPKTGVSIEISTNGESKTKGFEVYQAEGEFDRLESEDFNDFRWIVSLGNLHNENLTASTTKDIYPISKLFIENGLFYVHKLDSELYFEKIIKDSTGNEKTREDFGNIGETIGVMLEVEEVNFKIKIGDNEESHTLSRSGFPYRIEINNMNYEEDAVMSDLPDYYKYIENTTDNNFELLPVIEPETSGGSSVGGKIFCHPIMLDIATIEDYEG